MLSDMPNRRLGLASTLSDASGLLAGKLELMWPSVVERFDHISIVATADTAPEVLSGLRPAAHIELVQANIHAAGGHRRRAVELALRDADDLVMYIDLDHLLRWIEREPDELDALVRRPPDVDTVVVGRTADGFTSSPARLQRTEGAVNDLFAATTGLPWDIMMAVRIMRPPAARYIISNSAEPSLATDVEWPLLLMNEGFSLEFIAAHGLTYETNLTYGEGVPDTGDQDLDAWLFRFELAVRHLRVMSDLRSKGAEQFRGTD